MTWTAELALAADTARKAGAHLRALALKHKAVLSEVCRDIKLQADRDSEAIILEALSKSEYPVLAEESGEHGLTDDDAPFWVVDPLDGTLNFSRGLSICCTSIALCHKNEALLGVVYDFNHDECFQGGEGAPAQCNDTPIHVSKVAQTGDAILATGFPVNRDFGNDAMNDFLGQLQQFKKVRLLGSAALSLANVSCGRVDAYAEDDIMFWDVAAGIALVQAAGGYVDMQPSDRLKWGKRVRCAACADIWAAPEGA